MSKIEQEQLIVSNERTQQYAVRDFSESGPSVNLLERNIRLQNVLDLLKEKQRLENYRWVLGRDTDLDDEVRGARVESTSTSIKNVTKHTKEQFAHAAGMYALIDSGVDERIARRTTRSAFSDFLRFGSGIRDNQKANSLRTRLEQTYPLIEATTPIDIPMNEVEDTAEEALGISAVSRERRAAREDIMRIRSDDRAGFLPATHQEKNLVLPWLDYLDNPDRPRGVWHQLEEVFAHQQRFGHGVSGGVEALRSIVYEVEDYATNAEKSAQALEDLQARIDELVHYRFSLAGEFGDTHNAYAVLARHIDITSLLRQNPQSTADMMTTKLVRWQHDGPGKHKRIEDHYTTETPTEAYQKRIETVAATPIVEVRPAIAAALLSERRRAEFYTTRLEEIVSQAPHSRYMQEVTRIAQDALGA